jgi:AraC family transcriptional regulator
MQFQADGKYHQALLATLVHIQTHLTEFLTLEGLAARAGFSPYHFHRIFTEFVGEPVKEYIRRLRLERGAYRLKVSRDSVLEIALEAGFKTHESFTRAFKRQFGVSPRGYRKEFLRLDLERRARPDYAQKLSLANEAGRLENQATDSRVRLERLKPLQVAFTRYTGPYEALLKPGSPLLSLWQVLFDWGQSSSLIGPGSLLIGIPQDDPSVTPADRLRFDVCIQVANFGKPDGLIGFQTIDPGLYAVGRHYGSFDRLQDTYLHIYDVATANQRLRLRAAPCFEVYSHTRLAYDLHIHFTDVYMPVEPVESDPLTPVSDSLDRP